MRKPRNKADLAEYKIVEGKKSSERSFRQISTIESDLKVALIFPSTYQTAISNLGFHRVFEILNAIDGIQAERFFYDPKFSKYYSLDSFRPLDEFQIWAFSVSFEMDFRNVIEILLKKKIPLSASARKNHHPLIMLGGAVTYFNTNALWDNCDIIFHGDGEETLDHIMALIRDELREKRARKTILENLKGFSNLSIPPLGIENSQIIKSMSMIKKPAVSICTSKSSVFPGKVLIEIGRGCLRNCSFCVAGHTRNPARFVDLITLNELVSEMKLKNFNECGLISATFTDHPQKDGILDLLEEKDIKFSLSSLRLDSISEKLIDGLLRSGQKEMTIAPEGGSQKIRDIMNKQITEQHIENAFKMISAKGIKKIKMYFIYGLEEEDENDFLDVKKIADEATRFGFEEIRLSFNPLIPKPLTPFANRQIEDIKTLKQKKKILMNLIDKKITCKFESIRNSHEQYKLANASKDFRFPEK